MADNTNKELKKMEKQAQVSNTIYDKNKIYERTKGAIVEANPGASSLRYLHKNKGSIGDRSSLLPPEAIKDLMTAENMVTGKYRISSNVSNLNPWRNPAQYTAESIEKVRKMQNGVIWATDVEWLAGGDMSFVSPVELAILPIEIENGLVKNINKSSGLMIAVQLEKEDAQALGRLIDKVRETPKGSIPNLTDDELRSLVDMVNYAGKDTIDPSGIVMRTAAKPNINRQNIQKFLPLIQDGFDNLRPGNHSRAIKRAEVGTKVSTIMMNRGYKLQDDPMFVWHNGLNADVPVLEKAFGKDVAQIFGASGKAQHLDTLAWTKAVVQDPLSLHKLHKKGKANIQGISTLGSMSQSLLGYEYAEHVSLEDAYADGLLLDKMLKDKDRFKDIDVSKEIFGRDTKNLFSTESIIRGKDTPLNMIYEQVDGEWVARSYQPMATYKNALHEIKKEFEYEYSGKRYYGVVLHNIDDDLYSTIAYDNVRDLQNVIQQNFTSMDRLGNSAEHKAIRKHIETTRARREYSNMFNGTKNSYRSFDRYMKAYDYIIKDATVYGGKLSSASTKKLVDNNILSKSQADKFSYMFPRIRSEYDILSELKANISSTKLSDDQKSVALALFNQNMEKHIENVPLPSVYSQARIWDPVAKTHRTVNTKSAAHLASSLRNIALEDGGNFVDASYKLKSIVGYLASDGTLEKSKAKKLIRSINKVTPFQGAPTRNVHDIALSVATNILEEVNNNYAYNIIEGQESLAPRTGVSKTIKTLKNNNMFDKVTGQAGKYFKFEGNLGILDPKLEEKLSIVDSQLRKYVSGFSEEIARDIQNLGPSPIIDQIQSMAKAYESKGIGINAWVAQSSGNHGLELAFYDLNTATQIVGNKMKNAAHVFIPLVNDQGILTVGGVPGVNMLVPSIVDYNTGRIKMNTTQHRMFDVLSYTKNVEELSKMIRNGELGDATNYASRKITKAARGLPTGMRYTKDLVDDTVASSILANITRSGWIDFNNVIYQAMKEEYGVGFSLSNFKEHGLDSDKMMRSIFYSTDILQMIGVSPDTMEHKVGARIAGMFKDIGIKYNASAIKGERAQAGYGSIEKYDPRRYGIFGFFSDTGRENDRQKLNYLTFKDDDIISVAADGSLVTRKSVLERLDPNQRKRMTTRFVGTESLFRDEPGTISLNLNTAFMNDKDIAAVADRTNMEKTHPLRRITTHDDMMVIRTDVAESFGAMDKKVIHLGSDEMPLKALQERIAAGETVVIRQGEILTEGGFSVHKYEDKFDSIVRNISANEKTGGYDVILDQIMPERLGMKLAGFDSGNKFTVGLMSQKEIVEQLGTEFTNIEAIVNVGTKKLPGDMLASQLNMMMYEMQTVGKLQAKDMQDMVAEVLEKAMGKDATAKLKNKIRVEQAGDVFRLIMPDRISNRFNVTEYIKAVSDVMMGRNVINKNGIQILTGLMGFMRMNVADYQGGVGEEDTFVKVGLRELEMLNSRSRLYSTDISKVVQLMEGTAFANSGDFIKEGQRIRYALAAGSGYRAPGDENIPTIRTRNFLNDGDMEFNKLKIFPTQSRGYLNSELQETIVDPNLFGGKPFYLELPDTFKVGDSKSSFAVDRVLIAGTKLRGVNGEIHLDQMQMRQKQLFSSIMEYNNAKNTVDSDEAKRSISSALEGLYNEYGKAMKYSKGYIAENALSNRAKHSGIFTYRTVDPNSYVHKYANQLEEGYAIMSRYDLADMLSGVKDADKVMEMAEKQGLPMIDIRWPVKDLDTVQFSMFKVLSEAQEKEIDELSGRSKSLMGNVYATVGTQVRHNADMDGDTKAVILPQIAGNKAKGVMLDQEANQQMINMFYEEQKITKAVAAAKFKGMEDTKDLIYRGLMDGNFIDPKTDIYDTMIGIESRLQKKVGIFSNMATRYRRIAEATVGSMETSSIVSKMDDPYLVTSYLTSAWEQAPISAKRLGEHIKSGAAEEFEKHISSVSNLYESLSSFDIDTILKESKNLGFFEQNEAGTWIFAGGVKDQGRVATEVLGRPMTIDDARKALETVQRHMPKGALWDSHVNAALGDVSSGADAIRYGYNVTKPTKDSVFNFYAMEKYMQYGVGDNNLIDKMGDMIPDMNEVARRRARLSYLDGIAGGNGNRIPLANVGGAEETVGGNAVKGIKNSFDNMFKGLGGSGAAVLGMAALGAFAISSLGRGGPNIEHEPVEAHEDQAPSSDGSYVNPMKYAAGAPAGAGPTAYVSQKGSGYERINVKINGNVNQGMTNAEVSQLISDEIRRQAGVDINLKISSEDNRQTIDRQWLQTQFANALKTGYVY